MAGRRFLLMHVTTSSGHHKASRALEHALRRLDPLCQTINVDAFDYTSHFVRFAINRSYLQLIRHHPDVWEYLYDNPAVHRRVQHIRGLLHRYHARKLQRLLETVQPHAMPCTQAFPSGMVADFKKHHNLTVPLVGVLTDYAPHLYWLHETVDRYIVPADELRQRFISYGIQPSQIQATGIPIEPRFLDPVDRSAVYREFGLQPDQPVVLVMGGGSGFGPLRELMTRLGHVTTPCQIVLLAGTNRPLVEWCAHQRFSQRVVARGYVESVPELMDIASLLITKPGGMTMSESLARRLPMLMLSPIPGQEMCNARYLLQQGAALLLGAPDTAREVVGSLLSDSVRLQQLRDRIGRLSKPDSAMQAAQSLIHLADRNGR